MLNNILSFIRSSKLMAVLFIAFAIAMAAGTFIENEHNINAARILVYNSWWFEAIMALFIINFAANIKTYRLYKKRKWPTLSIHLAFVIILIGAFVTRYYSFDGLLSIREGSENNEILLNDTYLNIKIQDRKLNSNTYQNIEKKLLLSQQTQSKNKFTIDSKFEGTPIQISYRDFTENASFELEENDTGNLYLKIVVTEKEQRREDYLKYGESVIIDNTTISFGKPTENAINIDLVNEVLFIRSYTDGSYLQMTDLKRFDVPKNQADTLKIKSLYSFRNTHFVIPEKPVKGTLKLKSNPKSSSNSADDALTLNVKLENTEKQVTVFGKKRKLGNAQTISIDDLALTFTYGSKIHTLPFSIELQDFIAEKYPGTTNSYAAFKSKVLVKDSTQQFKADIYMNHVLDFKGYRFFQASFHPDEKGTILSVNHDFLGTYISYFGYFVLYLGLLLILFNKYSRFGSIKRELKFLENQKTAVVAVVLCLVPGFGFSDNKPFAPTIIKEKLDSIILHYQVPIDYATKFGQLVVQDMGGRMKPLNTYSSELLRKVSKKDTYQGLNADQAFLSMLQFPQIWYNIPLVYVKPGNDSIRNILNVPADLKRIPLAKFFNADETYKLEKQVQQAYKSLIPNQFEKDFIETDRRVNLLLSALTGQNLKIFPVLNDQSNLWISPYTPPRDLSRKDAAFVKQIIPYYFEALTTSLKTKDYSQPDALLDKIEKYQIKYGGDVRPKQSKIKAETLYNKYDVFKKLFSWYLFAGLGMLIASITFLFKQNKLVRLFLKINQIAIYLFFAAHTAGLVARWYISGHAPWSDAYESIIYVSWATMLFGIILGRKSNLTLAATTFVTSMILMVAHWNWLDPAIANLQPVLNSYWLMIHVAVIVASYGPFTLGMILGTLSMLLMCFLNKKNHPHLRVNITKLVLISELALTVGLVMITIGNFLGGQWANESWGRYWAWDPKETWALISIMVYSLIIHLRIIPFLNSKWLFSLVSVLGYYSILMTYFGVNFYLSGLHSYAKGENVVTPNFVYYSLLTILVLAGFAYYKQKKYSIK